MVNHHYVEINYLCHQLLRLTYEVFPLGLEDLPEGTSFQSRLYRFEMKHSVEDRSQRQHFTFRLQHDSDQIVSRLKNWGLSGIA